MGPVSPGAAGLACKKTTYPRGSFRGVNGATASDKGLLRPQEAVHFIDLRRYRETGLLGQYVERYWSVHWDLPDGASYESVVIPHPCVNLSFMPVLGAELHGPGIAVSRHPLTGRGRVFGVKFRPGGFTAFSGVEGAALADWSAGAATVFGPEVDELQAIVMSGGDIDAIRGSASSPTCTPRSSKNP